MATTKQAPSPFDQDSADVILRSSDGVHFRVHSVILAQASPFFRTMFTLPQPKGADGPPSVIDCAENSNVLTTLLTLCYPIVKPRARPFTDIEPAARAAQKYEMDLPVEILKDELRSLAPSNMSGTSRISVWAIACRLRFEDVARTAAVYLDSRIVDSAPPSALEGVSAADLFRLRKCYHSTGLHRGLFNNSHPYRPFQAPSAPNDSTLTFGQVPPYAYAPDNIPSPDVICRSLDGVDLPAHRAVLAMASTVLRKRLTPGNHENSQLTSQIISGTPVLQFDADEKLLKVILNVCFYLEIQSIPTSTDSLATLIAAAKKYDIAHASDILRARWESAAQKMPLAAYLSSTTYGLSDHAPYAVPYVLHEPRTVFDSYLPVMETAPAAAYQRLLMYYNTCNAVVDAEISKVKKEHPEPPAHQAPPNPGNPTLAIPATAPQPPEGLFTVASLWGGLFPKPKNFLHTFLDTISRGEAGPYQKVQKSKNLLREYVKWCNTKKEEPLPTGNQTGGSGALDAGVILHLSKTLPDRLDNAIKTVIQTQFLTAHQDLVLAVS
ncbi:hypothetical protein C8Q74DRAFT_1326886 [Fomes fomentarius]|nr:hypothetical protein C8Q74DRAFT_1326886 [Fomes fomentarius]